MSDDLKHALAKAEELLERERIEAEELLERERIEAEELLERERIEAENIRSSILCEAETVVQKALIDGEQIIQKALIDGENLLHNIVNSNNLKKNIMSKIDQLRELATNGIENIRKLASVAITNIKQLANVDAENLKKAANVDAENLKKAANVDAENLKKRINQELENLRRMASVDSERLKSENVRTYNLTEQAILICENRKNDTLIKSERLRLDAKIKSHKLLDHANFINESIKRKADIDAATIREKANSHASELIENAHDEAEKIRHLSYIQRLKSKKQQLLMITSVLAVVLVVVMFYSITQVVPPQVSNFRTGYVIQNLKGDTVDTWVLWHHPSEKQFDIHVKNSQFVTKERLDAIRDVVLSQETLKIDDSLLQKGPQGTTSIYYAGWLGALDSIDTNTKFPIVRNLNFGVDDEIPTGDIMIELTDLSSPDGYSGYTASIVDDSNHQILKSTITIYNINKISTENLKTIVRHELGHGFGLGHSTANEDLMAPVITTSYPYISQCDLDAIRYLYDGGQKSQVICAK